MSKVLQFIHSIEIWFYLLLGLIGIFYLRKFFLALAEWRGAIFGLERDNAQRRLNEATSALVLILLMSVAVFVLTTFLLPTIPAVQPLPTTTLNVLATPTITLAAQTGAPAATATLQPTVALENNACQEGKLEITSPAEGEEVSGVVEIKGVVNVENFGFYKYEYALPGGSTWVTIAAGSSIDPQGDLGFWDTSQLSAGVYLLRIVVADNQGIEQPACFTQVRVVPPA